MPIQPTIWIITILRIMSTRNNRRPSPQGAETHQVASTTQFVFSTSENLTKRAQLQFVALVYAVPGSYWGRAGLPFYRSAGPSRFGLFPQTAGLGRFAAIRRTATKQRRPVGAAALGTAHRRVSRRHLSDEPHLVPVAAPFCRRGRHTLGTPVAAALRCRRSRRDRAGGQSACASTILLGASCARRDARVTAQQQLVNGHERSLAAPLG